MAGKFDQYKPQIEKFNSTYGVNFSFEAYESESAKTNAFARLFGARPNSNPENIAYQGLFVNLYREAIENHIDGKSDKTIDPVAFLEDYETLINEYRLYAAANGKKAPGRNGGWESPGVVAEAMSNSISNIKSDKAEYVKDKYLARKLRLRDMRADIDRMKKNPPVSAEDLSRAMVYMRALNRTVNNRTSGWRALHWIRNRAEKRDLQALQDFVTSYNKTDIYAKAGALADEDLVSEAREKLDAMKPQAKQVANEMTKEETKETVQTNIAEETKETVKETVKETETEVVKESAQTTVNEPVQKPAETVATKPAETVAAKPAETVAPKLEKRVTKEPEKEREFWSPEKQKAEKLAKDTDLEADMKAQILKWAVKGNEAAAAKSEKTGPNILQKIACDLVCKDARGRALAMWDAMNEKTPEAIEKNMAEAAFDFCMGMYTQLDAFKLDKKDRLVVAQNITNMMINKFSPAAFNEKYAKFGDNYFMNTVSVDQLQTITNIDDRLTTRSLLVDAKQDLAAGREPLDLSDAFGKEKNQDKAPQIKEGSVPTKNMAK